MREEWGGAPSDGSLNLPHPPGLISCGDPPPPPPCSMARRGRGRAPPSDFLIDPQGRTGSSLGSYQTPSGSFPQPVQSSLDKLTPPPIPLLPLPPHPHPDPASPPPPKLREEKAESKEKRARSGAAARVFPRGPRNVGQEEEPLPQSRLLDVIFMLFYSCRFNAELILHSRVDRRQLSPPPPPSLKSMRVNFRQL